MGSEWVREEVKEKESKVTECREVKGWRKMGGKRGSIEVSLQCPQSIASKIMPTSIMRGLAHTLVQGHVHICIYMNWVIQNAHTPALYIILIVITSIKMK